MICYSLGNCFEKTTFCFDGIRDNSDKAHFHCESVHLILNGFYVFMSKIIINISSMAIEL